MEKSTRESTRNAKFNLSEATKAKLQIEISSYLPPSLFLSLSFRSNVQFAIVVPSWRRNRRQRQGRIFFLPRLKSGSVLRKTFRQSFIWIEPGSLLLYWFYFSDNVVNRIIATGEVQSFGKKIYRTKKLIYIHL